MIKEYSKETAINNYTQHETCHVRVLPHHPKHSVKSNNSFPERQYAAQLQG